MQSSTSDDAVSSNQAYSVALKEKEAHMCGCMDDSMDTTVDTTNRPRG